MRTIWCAVSDHVHLWLWCHDATSWSDVTMNTDDIISWHGHDIIGLAYRRCCTAPLRVHLILHIWLFTSGTHACLDWCADVPAFQGTTSFKCNLLGCCYCCEHSWCVDALTYFRNILWVPLHLLHILSPQDCPTFGWCLCALSLL